jgi:hypothetical protein
VTEITVAPLVVAIPVGMPALIRSLLLAGVICFIAAFWITPLWWGHWLVALLALTACLTTVVPRIAMVAPFVGVLQRKKPLGVGAEITVVWSDERHIIVLSPGDWQRVKGGAPVTLRSHGYIYREEWFGDIWRFNGPMHELVVDYHYSDGETGTGYNGSLSGVHIIEEPSL